MRNFFKNLSLDNVVPLILGAFLLYQSGAVDWAWRKVWPKPPVVVKEDPVAVALRTADRAAEAAQKKHLDAVKAFFDRRAANAPRFADAALEWESKLLFLGSALGWEDRNAHADRMRRHFERLICSPADIRQLVEGTAGEYRKDLERIDAQFVIDLRRDVPDSALLSPELVARLQSPATFDKAYAEILARCGAAAKCDVGEAVVAQLVSGYAANLAVNGLGLSVGGWIPTLVANVAADFLIGKLLDWILDGVKELIGFDPAGDVAREVRGTVGRMRDAVVTGDPAVWSRSAALDRSRTDPRATPQQRAAAEAELGTLLATGNTGLTYQFVGLRSARAAVRRELANQARAKK